MTQKELLYVEDAIEHEKSIIKICLDATEKLNDADLVAFIENNISKHQDMQNELTALLKENVNG